MEGMLELYRRKDFERADFALARLTPQGQNDDAVDVLWTIRRGAQPPRRFHTYEEQRARTGTC